MKKPFHLAAWAACGIFLAAAGAFAAYRAYGEFFRNKRIAEEIRVLQEEANHIDQENQRLRDKIEYLQSDSFREQEAKRVLEYRKIGEKVVIIRDRGTDRGGDSRNFLPEPHSFSGESANEPNYLKWWYKFF